MDSAIYKLKQFVSDANNSVMQYNNAISKLEQMKTQKADLQKRKNEQLHSVQLTEIKRQHEELDNVNSIFKSQNLPTFNLDKIRNSIISFEKILTAEKTRTIEEYKTNTNSQIDKEIEHIEKEKLEYINKQKELFFSINNELDKKLADERDSFLTKEIEIDLTEDISIKNAYPSSPLIRIADKSFVYEMFNETFRVVRPVYIPFICNQNICISYPVSYNINNKLKELVCRVLLSSKIGNTKFFFFDNLNNGENFKNFLALNPDLYSNEIISKEEKFAKKLDELEANITQITQTSLRQHSNIIEYNLNNPKQSIPLHFIIIDNFPYGTNDHTIKKLNKLNRLGPKAGVHIIYLGENLSDSQKNGLDNTFSYTIEESDLRLADNTISKLQAKTIVFCKEKYNPDDTLFWSNFIPTNNKMWESSSINSLHIPIGKTVSEDISLVYNNQTLTHGHVVGKSGSGKSSLLHTVIMSAAYRYSPEELELWLMDFKEGNEFLSYEKGNLPHVKLLTLKNDEDLALHALGLLSREGTRRANLFKSADARDYVAYRTKTGERLPRILAIIDEYQLFFKGESSTKSVARTAISNLLEKGRSYGISLLFASQSVHLDQTHMSNIATRIVLMTDLAKQLLESNSPKAFSLKMGQAIFNCATGSAAHDKFVKSFYFPEKERQEMIVELSEKCDKLGIATPEKWVFDEEAKARISNIRILKTEELPKLKELTFVPGEKIHLDGSDYECILRRIYKENILVVSGNISPSVRALYGSFVTLIPQILAMNAPIYMMNFVDKYNEEVYEGVETLSNVLKNITKNFTYINNEEMTNESLDKIIEHIEYLKAEKDESTSKPIEGCLVVFNAENNSLFDTEKFLKEPSVSDDEPFSFGGSSKKYPPAVEKLRQILDEGPGNGFYSMIQHNSCDGYYKVFYDIDLSFFHHRIALQMSYDDSRKFVENGNLAGNLHDSNIGDATHNRSRYFNIALRSSAKLKPFEFLSEIELNNLLNK